MDLDLAGVHVLVTGMLAFELILCTVHAHGLKGANGGIGLETVKVFLGNWTRFDLLYGPPDVRDE